MQPDESKTPTDDQFLRRNSERPTKPAQKSHTGSSGHVSRAAREGGTEPPMPAVIYGVKSSPDEKESVADQHERCLAAIESEARTSQRERRLVAPPFGEEKASGYRGERGPKLDAAMRAAIDAAAEHGEAELWVFHSSRLARGDGRKGRRGLDLIVAQLRYEDVQVRSVADDEFVRNPMLVGVAAQQNHKYAADLSANVRRGKQRQLRRGEHLGGPVPDGYAIERVHDSEGRVIDRLFRLDPVRGVLVRSIFDLALAGLSDAVIARRLNAAGHRTRHDRAYDRRAVQNTLTNPFYAGRIAYKRGTVDEEVVQGRHPALVDPADFDAVQRMRAMRDKAAPSEKATGRPNQNHALARLARCGRCGERLYAVTSSYRRKDGTRARSYMCHAYKQGTGTCDAKPIDAEVLDAGRDRGPRRAARGLRWLASPHRGRPCLRARAGREGGRARAARPGRPGQQDREG
jgi:hypothetical protein